MDSHSEMYTYARELCQRGVTVIPLLIGTEHLVWYHVRIRSEMQAFPEFRSESLNNRVLGAFGALGNPASFHSPTVRELRRLVHGRAHELVRNLTRYEGTPINMEQLFDRLSWRQPQARFVESWHRDESESALAGDRIFGGWINLSRQMQQFVCFPGSHVDAKDDPGRGFAKIPKGEHACLDSQARTIDVNPGEWIVFDQTIAHKVSDGARFYFEPAMRLYVGFRLTKSDRALHAEEMDRVFADQACPRLPSGQRPPLYSAMHASVHLKKTIRWCADNVKDIGPAFETKQKNANKKRKRAGSEGGREMYKIARRFMPSLRDLGLPLYEEYNQAERSMYAPTRIRVLSE